VKRLLDSPSRKSIETALENIENMSEYVLDIGISLDKIKNITKPLANELELHSVNRLWEEAFALVAGRLDTLGIRHNITGRVCECEVYPDFLRHAFLNLILNSVDAFKERRLKGHRMISVTIDTQGTKADSIRMRYADNATGIDVSRLKRPDGSRSLTANDIFDIGVTSKEDGSGHGLFLVRRMLDRHGGSIDLVDFRSGVVFDITLPKVQ
jgi:signal transduction histidine kinase